jgi:hypothetical protein
LIWLYPQQWVQSSVVHRVLSLLESSVALREVGYEQPQGQRLE